MKQPHTEETIKHTEDEQNTGNHKVQGNPDAGGADRFGGTRAGAENFEHAEHETTEKGNDPEKASSKKSPD